MAWITTKEYIAARQMKKNGDCIPGKQGEMTEKADISVVHLSNIELGKKTPGLSTLIRIAEALDVATDWILRTNTPGTYAVANEKIGELLADCTNDEMLSVLRILEEVKKAMRHN